MVASLGKLFWAIVHGRSFGISAGVSYFCTKVMKFYQNCDKNSFSTWFKTLLQNYIC